MAGHQGVAIAFISVFLLGLGHLPATAGDAARSSPIKGKSAAKPASEAEGIQTPARVLSVYDVNGKRKCLICGNRKCPTFEEGVDADPTLSGWFQSGMRGWTEGA